MAPRSGVSLIELAIVLVIIGILLSASLSSGDQRKNYAREQQTHAKLDKIEEALANYLRLNGKLPYPARGNTAWPTTSAAVNAFGIGDAANTLINITATENWTYWDVNTNTVRGPTSVTLPDIHVGTIPTKDIGLPDSFMLDGWGNRFTYVVEQSFANRNSFRGRYISALQATVDAESLRIVNFDPSGNQRERTNLATNPINDRDGAAVIIISHGANGWCAWPRNGGSRNSTGAFAVNREAENCDDVATFTNMNTTFAQDAQSSNFDDIVRYYSKERLLNLAQAVIDDGTVCDLADITLQPYIAPCQISAASSYFTPGPAGCETNNANKVRGGACNAPSVDQLTQDCVVRQLKLAHLVKDHCL